MQLRGAISERDYLAAQWLHMKPRRRYRVPALLFGVVMGLGLAAGFFATITRRDGGISWPVACVLAAVPLWLFLKRWSLQRLYRSQSALQGLHSMQLDDEGVASESEHGSGRTTWSALWLR